MKVPEPRKLKSGTWFIQLRLGGTSIPVTASTSTECRHKAELLKAEYRTGQKLLKKKQSEKTIDELIEDYINSRRKVLSPSTIRGYMSIKDNRFESFRDRVPSSIKNWQSVINQEIEDEVSAKTIKNSWRLLASALEYGGHPVPSVKLPQIMPSPRPWLDADQIKTFVKAIKDTDCEIPALLALHSLRRSEIMGLTWDKIDLKKKTIRVEGSAVYNEKNKLTQKATNKSKRSKRTISIMIPELETALSAVPADKRKGNIITCNANNLWAKINRICKANNLPEVGVHGLRHSFASLAHHVGMSEQDTMMIGGWEDPQTMHKIYEHISEADKLKSENKITEFFKNANQNAN